MSNLRGAIEQTVSISSFNRGLAGKIFDEVNRSGAKVVMKNNTAECILLSPDEYIQMLDEVHDARLLAEAIERIKNHDPSNTFSLEEIEKELGLSDCASIDDTEVEFD